MQRNRDTNKLTDPLLLLLLFSADDKFDETLTISRDKYYEIILNKFVNINNA